MKQRERAGDALPKQVQTVIESENAIITGIAVFAGLMLAVILVALD